jgi:tetratricopeptide (TPR) repeat protein
MVGEKMNLERAIQLGENGNATEAMAILKDLLLDDPNNPEILYHCAWVCDVQGLEKEAVPYYEKALENGLIGSEREGAFLGLGSTYRVIGEYAKSRAVFEKGMSEFPDNQALTVFFAMTLHNLKENDLAMETLLNVIATTTQNRDIKPYIKAIKYYKDNLNQTW